MNIAVIGMSGLYPAAENLEAFHKVLANKEDRITKVSDKRRKLLGLPENTEYQEIGFIEDIDCFDNAFFRVAAKEAVNMSPEQRKSLELAALAILDGGYTLEEFRGKNCGVVVASQDNDYYQLLKEKNGLAWIGSMKSVIAGRISHALDLHGASLVVDTGCSSNLVGMDDALMRLESKDIDYALVGGVTVYLQFGEKDTRGDLLGIEASNDRSKPFDAAADGIGVGEGGGFVLLKRAEDARRDRDHIYGLIRGSALSCDGSRCMSMTTPGVEGQKEAIQAAWKRSGLDISCVTELEAHGTGTKLGDPIEVDSFVESYQELGGDPQKKIPLSSVKGNIGHLNANAGIASLEKVLLGFQHHVSYPICGFQTPNPFIDFEAGVLTPQKELITYDPSEKRVVGINSFGLSGTNAHLIVENNPEPEADRDISGMTLLKLSAKTEASLRSFAEEVRQRIERCGVTYNLIATLNAGRDDYEYRAAVIADSKEGFLKELAQISVAKLDKKDLNKPMPPVPMRTDDPETLQLIRTLYLDGYAVDWKKFSGDYAKVSAPTYVFEKTSHWNTLISHTSPADAAEKAPEASPAPAAVPKQDVSAKLKEIWMDVLECSAEEIEAAEDFFELGGNSLLISILVEEIETAFGVTVDVEDIYDYDTLSKQTALIESKMPSADTDSADDKLLPMQQLLVNSIRKDPDSSKWNLCVSFQMLGRLDLQKLSDAFLKVCRDHHLLSTRIAGGAAGDVFERIEPSAEHLITTAQFDSESELKEALVQEALRAIRIEEEALSHLYLYTLDENKHYLLLKVSHVIGDGWTLNLIFEQLCRNYEQELPDNPEADLFFDYIREEPEQIRKAMESAKLPPAASDAKHRMQPVYQVEDHKCGAEHIVVALDRFRKLKQFAKEQKASLFQICLTVYHQTIQQYLGTTSSSVAIMQANRTSKQFRNAAGLMAKTVMVDAQQDSTSAMLRQIKEATGAFMMHQVISIADLMDEEKRCFEDFVDFMLTYQNFSNSEMKMDDIRFLPNMLPASEAVCPITILFYDTDQYLTGTVQYEPAYFSKDDVKRFIAIYQEKLDALMQEV